jgi:hypothetical protein
MQRMYFEKGFSSDRYHVQDIPRILLSLCIYMMNKQVVDFLLWPVGVERQHRHSNVNVP